MINKSVLLGCFFLMVVTASAGSLTDNGDGTITDSFTGLMWMQATADVDNNGVVDDNDRMNWHEAMAWCENVTLAGYSDWRLPNIFELRSLVDSEGNAPVITKKYFPDTMASNYWSSTTDNSYPVYAWYLYFRYGYESYFFKTTSYYVRAVRGRTVTGGHIVTAPLN